MMSLINRFHQIDIEGRGSVGKPEVIKAVQDQGEASYDQARETLKEVNLDSSGRVELEDYVEVSRRRLAAMRCDQTMLTLCLPSMIARAALCQAASRPQCRRRDGHQGQGDSQG